MLKTVEEIEDEILRTLILFEDDLVSTEEKMDQIVERGKKMLDDYEKELNEYYVEHEKGTYEEEYLAHYRQAKQNILEGVKTLLEKERKEVLSKVRQNTN